VRLSTDESDPGYLAWGVANGEGRSIRVLFDGADVTARCETCDDVTGEVVLHSLDDEGGLYVDPATGDVARVTLRGRVEITLGPETVSAAAHLC